MSEFINKIDATNTETKVAEVLAGMKRTHSYNEEDDEIKKIFKQNEWVEVKKETMELELLGNEIRTWCDRPDSKMKHKIINEGINKLHKIIHHLRDTIYELFEQEAGIEIIFDSYLKINTMKKALGSRYMVIRSIADKDIHYCLLQSAEELLCAIETYKKIYY